MSVKDFPDRILVICTGNICRSPLAEAMLRSLGADLQLKVSSAGLKAPLGIVPDALTVESAEALGYRIDPEKRSTKLNLQALQEADLILVMDRTQRQFLQARFPFISGKVFLVGHWSGYEIEDPIGKSREVFTAVASKLQRACEHWIQKLALMRT